MGNRSISHVTNQESGNRGYRLSLLGLDQPSQLTSTLPSLHAKPKPSPAAEHKKETQTGASGMSDARDTLAARKSLKVTGLLGALADRGND